MKTSEKGIALIKRFEGIHDGDLRAIGLQPKMCPSGIWTVGYGYALRNKRTGQWLKGKADYPLIAQQYPEMLTITEQRADELLREILTQYEDTVNNKVKLALSQNQFDALVSHTYNTGGSDTLFKLINADATMEEIQRWWVSRYIKGGGRVLAGLVARRREEFNLFKQSV